MKSVAISEFKAHCVALLEEVALTGKTLLVTKRGKPLARIAPSCATSPVSPQATLHGTVEIAGDVLAPAVPVAGYDSTAGALLSQERARKTRRAPR